MATLPVSSWATGINAVPGAACGKVVFDAADAEGLKTITNLAENMAWLLKKLAK